jgi:alpha-galactosidase/6-phospho-beta-glucosidase family protein
VGQVDNLPRNAVLETLAYLDAGGMRPLAAGSLPAPVVQYLMRHIPNQEMLTEAGLTGNREMAVCALANDPLIPDPCTAEKIAGDFFEAFRDYLPQFNGRWRL